MKKKFKEFYFKWLMPVDYEEFIIYDMSKDNNIVNIEYDSIDSGQIVKFVICDYKHTPPSGEIYINVP